MTKPFFRPQGGNMTRERVLVVFFFCSDLAVIALQSHALSIFRQLMQWSTGFITGRLSRFISSQGGWVWIINSADKLDPHHFIVFFIF